MTTDTQNIPGSDTEPEKRLYQAQAVVLPETIRLAIAYDLLQMREVELLKMIAEDVHRKGDVGETWPTVERAALTREFGGWRELTQAEIDAGETPIHEWHVRVSVVAVPR